jgi:hypothetical protein
MQSSKSKPIIYSQSTIVGMIDDTTGKYIKTVIVNIMNEFDTYLKSEGSAATNSWEYMFDCNYIYMSALNIEIQKHFDSSVFVRIYGGGIGATSNKLICKVNWGAD